MKTKTAKPLAHQPTWKDIGLDDLRNVDDQEKQPEPELLAAADSLEKAAQILAQVLGIDDYNPERMITTPIEEVTATRYRLGHLVEKRGEDRERYAEYLLPTLENPFEIWNVAYDDGSTRNRYIGLFCGKRDLMVSVIVNPDGSLLWNMKQETHKGMNRMRAGTLLYAKKNRQAW
jgi:hypothetical protein